jgi:hypothetical protein
METISIWPTLFQKKNSSCNDCLLGPSNRPNQMIKLNPTS